jgi:hypothetical protein
MLKIEGPGSNPNLYTKVRDERPNTYSDLRDQCTAHIDVMHESLMHVSAFKFIVIFFADNDAVNCLWNGLQRRKDIGWKYWELWYLREEKSFEKMLLMKNYQGDGAQAEIK